MDKLDRKITLLREEHTKDGANICWEFSQNFRTIANKVVGVVVFIVKVWSNILMLRFQYLALEPAAENICNRTFQVLSNS